MSRNMQPVSVRLTAEERALVDSAAEHARTNVSDFMRRHAIEAAETELSERRIITIPAEDWDKFEAWCGTPGKDIPALRKLARARFEWK